MCTISNSAICTCPLFFPTSWLSAFQPGSLIFQHYLVFQFYHRVFKVRKVQEWSAIASFCALLTKVRLSVTAMIYEKSSVSITISYYCFCPVTALQKFLHTHHHWNYSLSSADVAMDGSQSGGDSAVNIMSWATLLGVQAHHASRGHCSWLLWHTPAPSPH